LNIPWTEPRDLRFDDVGSLWSDISRSGVSGRHRRGAGLFFLNGQIGHAKPSMFLYSLKNMITISGNESFCDNPY
jgi:hypothetical protein